MLVSLPARVIKVRTAQTFLPTPILFSTVTYELHCYNLYHPRFHQTMRGFILATALATATIHTVYAMPNSNLAVRSAFPDAAGIPHVSHPSHQHNRLYQGNKVDKGEQRMVLNHAAPGSVRLAEPREEQKASIAKKEKKKTRRGVLRERMIKNADYGSGGVPAGEAVAHSQAEPAPSPTSTPAAAPGSARISDDTGSQAAHA